MHLTLKFTLTSFLIQKQMIELHTTHTLGVALFYKTMIYFSENRNYLLLLLLERQIEILKSRKGKADCLITWLSYCLKPLLPRQ